MKGFFAIKLHDYEKREILINIDKIEYIESVQGMSRIYLSSGKLCNVTECPDHILSRIKDALGV